MVMILLQLSFLHTERPLESDHYILRVYFADDSLLRDSRLNKNGCALDLQCKTNPFFFISKFKCFMFEMIKNVPYFFIQSKEIHRKKISNGFPGILS
jgi:hypothetical protein